MEWDPQKEILLLQQLEKQVFASVLLQSGSQQDGDFSMAIHGMGCWLLGFITFHL